MGELEEMTGEEGKGGGGGAGGNTNVNATDNVNNVNANVNANVNVNINANTNVVHQNGGTTEKAPVVGGTNVETLPRAGKQVRILEMINFVIDVSINFKNRNTR